MMTIEEKIEVIKAFDEGREVEIYDEHYGNGKWRMKTNGDFWDFDANKYRVKPQPTRLEVANDFFEKTFGIKNEFNNHTCIGNGYFPCTECEAHKEGLCKIEKWWNEEFIGGENV